MWTDNWPDKKGYYWFYGWPYGDKTRPPELKYVKVWKTANSLAYVADGQFIYKKEAVGKWTTVVLPKLPEGINE